MRISFMGLSLSFVLLALAASAGQSDLQVAAPFSDNMVLQRGVPLSVWGWGEDGEKVTVNFSGRSVTGKVSNKKWNVKLPRMKAGGPHIVKISTARQTIQFTNVLVGEVWVCSGQSNMEWRMDRSFEPWEDIASATNSQIRLLYVPKNRQVSPTTRIQSSWQTSSPTSVSNFSAVAYYFGRSLQKALGVPVGLIGTYWGGTPAEAWISREGLEVEPYYRSEILSGEEATYNKWRTTTDQWEKDREAATKEGKTFNTRAPIQPWRGAELYNGMIAPLLPYEIRGAIWYQGESNAGRAARYRDLFPDMIRSWRRAWDHDLTFLCVQLAPFRAIQQQPMDSDWAELREAQLHATKVLPKVGMAVITDVGDPADIHPTKKEPVGQRLALAARALAYREKTEYSGPVYRSMEVLDGKVIVSFDHVGGGLVTKAGPLKGFAIAGEDRKFVWAHALIDGDTVVVSSSEVPKPVAVRYGWADYPVVNFWNGAGLPASPFRTDDFPMVTAPKPQ